MFHPGRSTTEAALFEPLLQCLVIDLAFKNINLLPVFVQADWGAPRAAGRMEEDTSLVACLGIMGEDTNCGIA
jgi:hypothetical protein